MTQAITDAGLNAAVAQERFVIVDLWAPWCAPCRILSPILADLEHELPLKVLTLNVDSEPETARAYHVRSIPTMLLFKDGKAVEKVTGAYAKAKLRQHFEAWLGE